ncbi:MAG: DUF3800 domain-containing protein [archaeon]
MYFLYLDESGPTSLTNPRITPQNDFFILGGIIIKEEDLLECESRFKEFKLTNLPTSIAKKSLHAVDLNHVARFKTTNSYNGLISNDEGKEILEKCYQFIAGLPIESIVVVIDNYLLKEKYNSPEIPYHLAYSIIVEKFQKIISKRNEKYNQLGLVNLADSAKKLSKNIKRIHKDILLNGTRYVKIFPNINSMVNIRPIEESSLFEIADLVCYAYRRSYYSWLCKNLNLKDPNESYLKRIESICTLNIGSTIIDDKIRVKVLPGPRFQKKKTK